MLGRAPALVHSSLGRVSGAGKTYSRKYLTESPHWDRKMNERNMKGRRIGKREEEGDEREERQ